MSGNLENDRSVAAGKMYPIDLAQKITIVKSVSNTEVKMAHLIPGQPKTSGAGQIITHTGSVGIMRPAAILSPSVSSQTQMIVSGSPLLQTSQIVSQGSQIIGPNSQIISQSQIISPNAQILSPGTQIISQGTQLSAQVSNPNNAGSNNGQVSVPSSVSGQVLSVGGLVSSAQGLVSGAGNLVVSSSVRTLPPSVRVLPPLPLHTNRPVHVNVTSGGGVLVSKGVTSHVPRGLAAGASLAVRPVAPPSASVATQGWSAAGRGRSAVVYGSRAAPRPPRAHPPPVAQPAAQLSHSPIVTLPTSTVLTSNSVISGSIRAVTPTPRPVTPTPAPVVTPRPLPLLQRNYQPKVVGVASVGPRNPVGNSAPAQLYYEVPRPAQPPVSLAPLATLAPIPRPLTPYAHAQQVNVVHAVQPLNEARPPLSSAATSVLPRPTILRKRDTDGAGAVAGAFAAGAGWEDVPAAGGGSGGSTTISAASSPPPDDLHDRAFTHDDVSPRKKPRKQMLVSEVRQCQEFQAEEAPPTPPPAAPPKRPQLSSSYVCGWRSTALHFTRPADVRVREPRAADILALASQKHILASAEGWKVHHLTAQMDDLVSLEADVGSQLAGILKSVEGAGGRAMTALQPHTHNLLELIKGNIQRSKIVCEGIQEAREDILRVFKHRNFVSDILTRQADKRCFRKHRSQS